MYMSNRKKNSKEKGNNEFFIYQNKIGGNFTGVCLTFDIVEEGADPESLMKSLEEAALLHIETVRENKLPDKLLNRPAPKKYWNKYLQSLEKLQHRPAAPVSFRVSPYMSNRVWQKA